MKKDQTRSNELTGVINKLNKIRSQSIIENVGYQRDDLNNSNSIHLKRGMVN